MFENFRISKKLVVKRGGAECHDFPSKICSLTVPKNFLGEPLCVSSISGVERIYAYDGKISTFLGKIVVSQYQKTS